MTIAKLEQVLLRARYKILVGMRPLGPARDTYNMVVAEFAQEIREQLGDDATDTFRYKVELNAQEDKWRTKTI